jgi:hypothetical protein
VNEWLVCWRNKTCRRGGGQHHTANRRRRNGVRGEASSDQIPDFTRDLRSSIKFLKKMPELRKAFE